MRNPEELLLAVQVARLYYELNLNQELIAKRLNITRQKVSRLLNQARRQGIVRISIHDPTVTDNQLSQTLKEKFGLHHVVLVPSEGLSAEKLRSTIGMAAARYLSETLTDNIKVGVGWGRTLFEVVNALPHNPRTSIHVIPLIGGIGDMSPFFQVNEIARRFAEAFEGTYRLIHVPAFTQDVQTWNTLMRMQEVKNVATLWGQVNIAIVGIGHLELHQKSSLFFADYISSVALRQLKSKGAIGDVCGRFFNIQGEAVTIGAGVIGIDLHQLRAIEEVIGVAGGQEKVKALLGALRGGYLKTLITDTDTAQAVLASDNSTRR